MGTEQFENIAFISYKHKDEKWAKWLQKKLEHYKIPVELCDETEQFFKVPRYIVRDRTDFSGGTLPDVIKARLHTCKYLILICSPLAAQSEWVCDEVKEFIALGREKYIIPFVVDGKPYSENKEEECFPEALLSLPKEKIPLGINVNEGEYELAVVKVISTMFGLALDLLWKRFKREKAKRRNKISRLLLFLISILILLPLIIAGLYYSTDYDNHFVTQELIGTKKTQYISDGEYVGDLNADTIIIKNISNEVFISDCNDVKKVIIDVNGIPFGGNRLRISNCQSLNEIEIKGNVEELDCYFVQDCPSLRKITMPSSIRSISTDAITNCQIADIKIKGNEKHFVWKDNCLWDIRNKQIVYSNLEKVRKDGSWDERIELRYDTRKIMFYTDFPHTISSECSEITYIDNDKDTILFKNILNSQNSIVGATLYHYNSQSDVIDFDSGILKEVDRVKPDAFRSCKNVKKITGKHSIAFRDDAFAKNNTLEKIVFDVDSKWNSGTLYFGDFAFSECCNLKEVNINTTGDVCISSAAFLGCNQLEKVKIKCNDVNILSYAFQSCPKLKEININSVGSIDVASNILDFDNSVVFKVNNDRVQRVTTPTGNCFIKKDDYSLLCKDGSIKSWNCTFKVDTIDFFSKDGELLKGKENNILDIPSLSIKRKVYPICTYKDLNFIYAANKCVIYNSSNDEVLYLPPVSITDSYNLKSYPIALKEIHLPMVSPPGTLFNIIPIIGDETILYVPYGTSKKYLLDKRYRKFKEIREDSFMERIGNIFLALYYTGYNFMAYYHCIFVIFLIVLSLLSIYFSICLHIYKYKRDYGIRNIVLSLLSGVLMTILVALVWFAFYWSLWTHLASLDSMYRIILSNIIAICVSYILVSYIFVGNIRIAFVGLKRLCGLK